MTIPSYLTDSLAREDEPTAPGSGAGWFVLRAQCRRRLIVGAPALLAAAVWGFATGWSPRPEQLTIALGAYLLAIGAILLIARATPSGSSLLVAGLVACDVAIVVLVVAVLSAAHPDRILILAFLVLYSAEACHGRSYALLALVVATAAFAVFVVMRHDARLLNEALPSGLLFVVAGSVFVARSTSVRRRLNALASLFERAEQGDLAGTYAVEADVTPDAITQLGRSYNRVREQLESMVLTDPLTGCLNRRGFDQSLAREVARSRRAGSILALLALDLDHFKTVNDTHGHQVGDDVLREAAGLLLQSARAGDVVCRVGGEEFALVLPDTDARGAFQVATRICELVRSHDFSARGAPVRLTASIGVSAGTPVQGVDTGALLASHADEALYAAKRSGRDRVRAWTPDAHRRRSGELHLGK